MKSRVASFLALTILAPAAWTQLFFDDELLWLRTVDITQPGFESQMPIGGFTFQAEYYDGGDLSVDLYGSLIFYNDGQTILNLRPEETASQATAELREIALYRPRASDGSQSNLNSTLGFNIYIDGQDASKTGWSMANHVNAIGQNGFFNPSDKMMGDKAPASNYMGFIADNSGTDTYPAINEVQTFVFWFDDLVNDEAELYPGILGFYDGIFDSANPDGPELFFRFRDVSPAFEGRDDSEKAIARLRPYGGGVIPVPEPATYLGASVLLLFIAGHFLHMRRRKKKAAK